MGPGLRCLAIGHDGSQRHRDDARRSGSPHVKEPRSGRRPSQTGVIPQPTAEALPAAVVLPAVGQIPVSLCMKCGVASALFLISASPQTQTSCQESSSRNWHRPSTLCKLRSLVGCWGQCRTSPPLPVGAASCRKRYCADARASPSSALLERTCLRCHLERGAAVQGGLPPESSGVTPARSCAWRSVVLVYDLLNPSLEFMLPDLKMKADDVSRLEPSIFGQNLCCDEVTLTGSRSPIL